jgi:GNAT superfamily N-acetyltransferase
MPTGGCNINVRPLLDADVPSVGGLLADCYGILAQKKRYSAIELEGLLRLCTPDAVRSRLVSYIAYVAEVNGTVVGFLGLEDNDVAELFVSPSCQRQGIGTALFRFAEQQLRSRGYERLTVHTVSAPAFYAKVQATMVDERVCDRGPLIGWPLSYFEKIL